jgi:hypothetical protein
MQEAKPVTMQKQNISLEASGVQQFPLMSVNKSKDNMTAKNIIKNIPANLRQHLREANIQPVDENYVAQKLQERLSANIISYLQLTALKLSPNTSSSQHMQLHAQEQRSEYTNALSERVSNIDD